MLYMSCYILHITHYMYICIHNVEVYARDLDAHVQNAIGDHMAIVLTKLSEIQNAVIIHNSKIKELQTNSNSHATVLATLSAGITANTVNLTESERKLEKVVHDNFKTLDNKLSKNANEILKTRNDLAQLKQQLSTPK